MIRLLCLLPVLPWAAIAVGADPPRVSYRIETIAGSSRTGDGGAATEVQLGSIQGIAADRSGNLYLSDTDHHRVRKISSSGVITTIAGTGVAGFSGDGGPAVNGQLNLPYGLTVDAAGSVYIADAGNHRVRRIGPDGVLTTVAGNGRKGSSGDGGAATDAQLLTPRNVVIDPAGNLYISEFEGHRVRKVSPDGNITALAGTGVAGFRGDGTAALNAQLGFPAGLALDAYGALYIADSQNQRVRKVSAAGLISTVLGGSEGTALQTPLAVAVDAFGTIYVADQSGLVRAYTAAGKWLNVAGTGEQGFSGDGGPATKARLTAPRDLALGPAGNLYVADGVRIRQVDKRGQIQTVAGDGYLHAIGDGGAAGAALLLQPSAVALDASGNLYVADTGTQRVRQILPGGDIQTLAGTGATGTGAEWVSAVTASLHSPSGVAVDLNGNVLIADTLNHRIRQVAADGRMHTVVGTGVAGIGPETMPPAQTPLRGPRAVCTDRAGTVFVVDTGNHRVLRTAPGALVETAAGNGAPGDAGDGGLARRAQLNEPGACALDSAGNLFLADTGSHRIRKVTPAGIISTVAGTGEAGASGDQGPATFARLRAPGGIAVDDNGDIFIADTGNHRIREVTPDGVIRTIAGQDAAGFAGDGGPATAAQLDSPGGLFLDGSGDLYLADTNNNRVRRLVPVAPPNPPPEPVLAPAVSAVNAGSLRTGAVAPGEIVTLFGTGLGPESGIAGEFDSTGLLASRLGGVEVRFDGVAAPLFYVQAGQVNAQAPYAVAGKATTLVEVIYDGHTAGAATLPVADAAPGLFPTVVNPDGGLNSEAAPAPRGTILSFYATGEGLTDGPNLSGKPAETPYPCPKLPVTLAMAGLKAEILYAGSAPGLVGVLQVNARVPDSLVPGPAPVDLTVGSVAAPLLNIWVK